MDAQVILDAIMNNWDTITAIVLGVGALIREHKKGRSINEALLIAINTLKDENKMDNGGAEFKVVDTMEKAVKVAEVMESKGDGLKKFEETLEIINQRKGIKIGSHKGQPIYLEDAIGIFGMLKNIVRR